MIYYPINEDAARRAKDANSFFEYKEGSATSGYKADVDEVIRIAEAQKKRVDPEYHGKIDYYVDLYARKMAENINKGNEIDARVPSVMIAGGGNFPTAKKNKQNAARDRNMEEWSRLQGIKDKIRSIGTGGIRSDEANAIGKLEEKLESLQTMQEKMKKVNAYYRKHKTLDGCPELTAGQVETIKAQLSNGWNPNDKPYPSWALSNNNANIRRIKKRIEDLKAEQESEPSEDRVYDSFTLHEDTDSMRIQFIFEGKPDEEIRTVLKSHGFRWSPKNKAWQRMLNQNGRNAAEQVISKIS